MLHNMSRDDPNSFGQTRVDETKITEIAKIAKIGYEAAIGFICISAEESIVARPYSYHRYRLLYLPVLLIGCTVKTIAETPHYP